MAKNYLRTIMASCLLAGGMTAAAQALTDKEATATWPFDQGTAGQTATISPEECATYFKTCYEHHGSSFSEVGKKTVDDMTQTIVKVETVQNAPSDNGAVNFSIDPKAGLTFTPTEVAFSCTRYGTDGGKIDIAWVNPDGTTVTLAQGLIPCRDNGKNKGNNPEGQKVNNYKYTVTGATPSEGTCGLRIYVYTLGATKSIGFGNVTISGKLNGTVKDVKQCNLTVKTNPEGAADIEVKPIGSVFDAGTELSLSQTRHFGYKFKNWTDTDGNILGTDSKLDYTISDDVTITANYETVKTFALNYKVNGGANDYMVSVNPAPHIEDNKNLFEDGTEVTLSASSNKILSFTGWSNGETTLETKITMDKDQDIEANYSAKDFIAAWDFIKEGSNGRTADFTSADNESATLVLRNAAGETSGWLDKCGDKGGYEGRPAAVNWRTTGLGDYYWQTMVNAANFTDIKVSSAMTLNYNSYQKQNVEYSLDGEQWTKIGTIKIEGAKQWKEETFSLPAAADNQSKVYIRWIADKTSSVIGATSDNDGAGLADIYITATAKIVDDGTAPALTSSVPAEGDSNVSANGKIVLNFDEKVKVGENIAGQLKPASNLSNGFTALIPTVYGKSVIFEYSNLDYATDYVFTLPAKSIGDLTDNFIDKPILIHFTTKSRPAITKSLYDFVVPDDGSFKEAIAKANKREDKQKRFRIFVKQGNYTTPADEAAFVTGSDGVNYPDPITYLTASNVSIIGEDMNSTTVVNTVPSNLVPTKYGDQNPIEGLHKCQTLDIGKNVTNTYLQDITLKSGLQDNTGRGAALEDAGDKTICKGVGLYGYQDTYDTKNGNGRCYFEGGRLRGRTDFLCGKGDVYYNGVELVMCEKGGFIAVPSTPKKYGYIFKDCVVKAEKSGIDGNFTLGRPWGSGTPIALFIDTRMEARPSALGWDEMSGGWPARYAEYNSTTATGSVIDLSGRKTIFGDGHINNPVLTADEAAALTLETVMGGDDKWDPTAATEQAPAPEQVILSGTSLTWTDSPYTLCWAVCQNGKVIGFTTEPAFTVTDTNAKYSVRAANEMGGMGKAVEAEVTTHITNATTTSNAVSTVCYNLQGIRVGDQYEGTVIRVSTLSDGSKQVDKHIR